MAKNVRCLRIFGLIALPALAFLCGCAGEPGFNHHHKSGDSKFTGLEIAGAEIVGIKTVMLTNPDGYASSASSFNFVLGGVIRENRFEVFDSYASNWNFFPHIYSEDIDGDGEKELIVEVPDGAAMGNTLINIYRHFPEAESGEPRLLAVDKPVFFHGDKYEFKGGKLIISGEGNYKDGTPIPPRVYRIERYKIVMESGGEDLRKPRFFLRPAREESDWQKLKELGKTSRAPAFKQ